MSIIRPIMQIEKLYSLEFGRKLFLKHLNLSKLDAKDYAEKMDSSEYVFLARSWLTSCSSPAHLSVNTITFK